MPDSSAEIRRLVTACLAGEPAGMPLLVQRFRAPVFGLCYRMLGQWQDAEDAVQDTFLRVAKSLSTWDTDREFEPWLLTIAANCCRTQLKRRMRQPNWVSLPEVDRISSASSQLDAEQLVEEVDRALDAMPSNWALAFRLFHQQGMSYEQMAQQLGRPEGTLKTWVYRARAQLTRVLRQRGALRGEGEQ